MYIDLCMMMQVEQYIKLAIYIYIYIPIVSKFPMGISTCQKQIINEPWPNQRENDE